MSSIVAHRSNIIPTIVEEIRREASKQGKPGVRNWYLSTPLDVRNKRRWTRGAIRMKRS